MHQYLVSNINSLFDIFYCYSCLTGIIMASSFEKGAVYLRNPAFLPAVLGGITRCLPAALRARGQPFWARSLMGESTHLLSACLPTGSLCRVVCLYASLHPQCQLLGGNVKMTITKHIRGRLWEAAVEGLWLFISIVEFRPPTNSQHVPCVIVTLLKKSLYCGADVDISGPDSKNPD